MTDKNIEIEEYRLKKVNIFCAFYFTKNTSENDFHQPQYLTTPACIAPSEANENHEHKKRRLK